MNTTPWFAEKLCSVPDTDGEIYGIAADNEGSVYFTVLSEGLFRHHEGKLEHLVHENVLEEGSEMCGIVLDHHRTLYSCDLNHHRILSYSLDTKILAQFAGTGVEGYKDGSCKDAQFCFPESLAIDESGDLIVGDRYSVRKIKRNENTVEKIASLESRMSGVVTREGIIYGTDYYNHCIRQIKDGKLSTLAGTPGEEGFQDGPTLSSKFNRPHALVLNGNGSLLVVDKNGIRTIDLVANVVSTLAIPELNDLSCIAIGSSGTIFVGTTHSIFKLAQK